MLVNSVVSICYYLAIPRAMIFEEPERRAAAASPVLVTGGRRLIAMVAVVAIGVYPELLAHFPPLSTLVGPLEPAAAGTANGSLEGGIVTMIGINRVKTWVLIAAMGGLFVLIGASLGGHGGAMVALGLALVFNFAMYWFSGNIASRPPARSP